MGQKLHGAINLTRIPKKLIAENKNGDKVLWIDIVPNKDGADQYGNTHSIQIYDKEAGKAVYLGNLKKVEFGKSANTVVSTQSAPPKDEENDLPF